MIRIEVLYGEVCNQYGELMNITYLEECIGNVEIIHTRLRERPFFLDNDVDLVYMAPCTEGVQKKAIESLRPYRDEIKQAMDRGVRILFTGNAYEVFGRYILDRKTGEKLECLGLLDFHTDRDFKTRMNSLTKGRYNNMDIMGWKSTFTEIYSNEIPFLHIEKGLGDHRGALSEGVRYKNFIGTDVLGPICIMNPCFTRELLKEMGCRSELKYSEAIDKAYDIRLKEFNEKVKKDNLSYN